MCNGIDTSTLPKSLKDAITVTKRLNFRYLWVDSLCIIQDSDEDKSHEISNMANVYKGSHLTINAAKAYNCNEGFLESQPLTRSYRDPNLAVRVPLLYGDEELGQVILEEDIFCADPGEPTYRRAWTFQERLLSRRQLIYGFDTLTWKCTTTTWNWVTWTRFCFQAPILGSLALPSDDVVTKLSEESLERPAAAAAATTLSLRKTPDSGNNAPQWRTAGWPYFQHYWLELVGIYSPLRLTDSADKLPGIAGVAAEVSRVSAAATGGLPAGRYLAGLWEADLPRQLLWTVYYPSEPEERGRRPYRAPSWSWASAAGDVYVHYPSVVQEYCSRPAAQVVECSTTPLRAEAPFGQVKDGFLRIRARLVRGAAVGERLGSSDGPITGEREFCQMDVVESVEAAKERALSSWWAQLGECCGLVLEKVGEDSGEGGLYRRVGIFHSETTSFPDVEPSVFTII
ncbi:hypothetical protein DIS24_g6002 [Lasiodiplodia hormozganensis]|uniref:Heterokaryon incompatibility domain-containing protein n=1 Tax=Lasiodiplodia hormozganensis TaxID=869390 RepID=A0AA39YIZ3_9PEZI|nr:hypothetical protein DIS24_g6002 [Lasiodiplodia hormozganensis]